MDGSPEAAIAFLSNFPIMENPQLRPIQIIHGHPPSKSNSYEIVNVGGRGTLAKTLQMRIYERDFGYQCTIKGAKISVPFRLAVDVYFRSNRSDLDNSLKIILDCLQKYEVIVNDRQCVEIMARKFIDKEDPRIVFDVVPLEEEPEPKKMRKRKTNKE